MCSSYAQKVMLQAIKQDVEAVIKNSLNNYFPNSYTVITLSLVTWGLAQFFVPWEMVDLLVHLRTPCHDPSTSCCISYIVHLIDLEKLFAESQGMSAAIIAKV